MEPAQTLIMNSLKKLPHYRLNHAEVVFAPFHDPEIACTLPLQITPQQSEQCRLQPSWDSTHLLWNRAEPGRIAATLILAGIIPRGTNDQFLFCLTATTTIEMQFHLRQGETRLPLTEWLCGKGLRMEIVAPIPDGPLDGIEVDFRSQSAEPADITLKWFGMANSRFTSDSSQKNYAGGPEWEGLIQLPDEWPSHPTFRCNLLFSTDDLPSLRRKMSRPLWKDLFTLLQARAREDLKTPPETWLGDYVACSDSRYVRAREIAPLSVFNEALIAGFVGIISCDREIALQALRHLMTIVHTTHWCASAEHRLGGSTWDQRCFLEEAHTSIVALLTDWYSWALTPRALSLISKSVWDKGLAVIDRDMMRWEYVHHINQGPWFCRARILGGLLLESCWPRMGDYVDRAHTEMKQDMEVYLLDDGGVDEGIHYFFATTEAVLPAMLAYAKSRRLPLDEVMPRQLPRCIDYVRCLSSTQPGKFLMDGDNMGPIPIFDSPSILAGLFPNQDYRFIVQPSLDNSNPARFTGQYQYTGTGVYACILGPETLPPARSIVPSFQILSKTGHLTSLRQNDQGLAVRIHLSGTKAGASHTHLDKGNLILEINETPFLIDRGTLHYADAQSQQLKRSAQHNVLTPLLGPDLYMDQAPATVDVIPQGNGNSSSLKATINLTNVWRESMHDYHRSIHSERVDEFILQDICQLKTPGHVSLHFHSHHPFTRIQQGIELSINDITLVICGDWVSNVSCLSDTLHCQRKLVHHAILTSKHSEAFDLITRLRIQLRS